MSATEHNFLIAGFDAGQTHTTCRLARLLPDGDWQRLGEAEGPGLLSPRRITSAIIDPAAASVFKAISGTA